EHELSYRARPSEWLSRLDIGAKSALYPGVIIIATLLIAALPLFATTYIGLNGWPLLVLAMLGLLPASDAAIALVNRVIVGRLGPATLPGMALTDGVPNHFRTMVVMPVLLTKRPQVEALIEQLEVHHLASSDGELYYALLSDWTDSDTETAP